MWIDIPGVCQPSCAPDSSIAIGPYPNRWMPLLHRPCGQGNAWDREETPLMFDFLLDPEMLEHSEHLSQPRHGISLGHAKGLKFGCAIAQGNTEGELPIADGIEGPNILSQRHRILQGEQHDARDQAHLRDFGCHAGEQWERLEHLKGRWQVMLWSHYRMKPNRLRQVHLFHEFLQTSPHVLGRGVLRVQLQAKLHTLSSVVE